MAREKQHVFSARTTGEGLRLLNGLRKERNVGWDDLVIDAVCAHYGLDRAVMALLKREKPAEPERGDSEQPPTGESAPEQPAATEQERPMEGTPAKKRKKGGDS